MKAAMKRRAICLFCSDMGRVLLSYGAAGADDPGGRGVQHAVAGIVGDEGGPQRLQRPLAAFSVQPLKHGAGKAHAEHEPVGILGVGTEAERLAYPFGR